MTIDCIDRLTIIVKVIPIQIWGSYSKIMHLIKGLIRVSSNLDFVLIPINRSYRLIISCYLSVRLF